MKKLFLFLCVVFSFSAIAQTNVIAPSQPLNLDTPGLTIDSIVRYLQSGLTASDSGEGGRASQVANFARIWRDRVRNNDSSGSNMFQQYFRAASLAAQARANASCNGGSFSGKWRVDGPDTFKYQNLGRMRDVWADANDTNKLLASGDGGVWKSTDGGKHWRCITDNAPIVSGIISPSKLAVNPTNTDNIYVGSYAYPNHVTWPYGMQYLNGGKPDGANYGHGLLVTNDGGNSWHQEILSLNRNPPWQDTVSGSKPFFSPDGLRVYGMRENHLFCKQVNGTWQDITPSSLLIINSSLAFFELKFVPNANGIGLDPNHFFVTQHGNGKLIECTYNPTTQNHSFTRVLFPRPVLDTTIGGCYISIPSSNTLYATFDSVVGYDFYGNAIYRSNLYTLNISTKKWRLISNMNIQVWEGGFEASSANPANLHLTQAWDKSYFSNDTGRTIHLISEYKGNPTHGDVRRVFIQSTTNTATGINDRVYFACDGGIFQKPKGVNPLQGGHTTCVNINGKGLSCGKYYGVSSLEKDGTVFAGMLDNNQWAYNPKWPEPWQKFGTDYDGGEAIASRAKEEGYVGRSPDGQAKGLVRTRPDLNGIYSSQDADVDLSADLEGDKAILPLWADQYGGYYVDKNNLWRILPNSTNYVQVSGSNLDPTYAQYDVHLPTYVVGVKAQPIRCMSFSQYYDQLTGYVMYYDGTLFYRNDLAPINTQNPTGFNPQTTTGFCKYYPPTDIVCDPRQPERVWLSLGGVDWGNSHRFRAMYSPDAGDHWLDISKGLPNMLPVVNIEYQEGSPYVYAATDAGMYRLDMSSFAYSDITNDMSAYNSVEWTCFNQGDAGNPDYPSINTPALNINYCSGRLYAATDGRGIWSTPLWEQFNVPNITPSSVITSNVTWSGTRYLTSGILVKSGATLTLDPTARIYMPKDGSIRIEAGAKLLVDGATITNGCKDCMWGSIIPMGNASLSQTAANQATVVVKNGALIENARNAITTWGGDIATTGAILNLSNSTFKNNHRSLEFLSYHNQIAGRRVGNVSRISGCNFLLDDDYRGTNIGYWFSCFASLWDVEGVVFSGNNFTNTNTKEENWSNGIMSYNAGYQVVSSCNGLVYTHPCTNFTRNSFSGLRHGIYAEGDNLTDNTFYVDQAAFDGCGVGVLARTNNHFNVSRSTFNIGNAPFRYSDLCNKNIGIRALSGCSGLKSLNLRA